MNGRWRLSRWSAWRTRKSLRKSEPPEGFADAYATALRLLNTSDRFQEEVRAKISAYPAEVVTAVLARLKVQHLVDDRRLVRALIDSNQGPKALSISALRAKCADRGASEDALRRFDTLEEGPLGPLLVRFERKERNRGRAGRYLASKGFEEDAIDAALERHFGPRSEPDETYNAEEA